MTLDLPITLPFRMDLEQYVKRADNAEKEIEDLNKTIETLLAKKSRQESQEVPEELLQLRVENTNLKSELEILQRTTSKIQSQKTNAKAEKARLVFRLFYFFNNSTKYDTLMLQIVNTMYVLFYYSDQNPTSSGSASKAQENIESQSGCEFCEHVGIHELKCDNEKRKTNVPLDKRLDNNKQLKKFQHQSYARKRKKKGKVVKGYQKDITEHFVFGQNVTELVPSKIANALLKRDANKFYNLQFPGNLKRI